jgi:hypothetical protein
VGNDPVNHVDPLGLWTFGIGLQGSGELALALGVSGGFYIGRNPDNGHWSMGFLFGPFVGGGGPISLGGGIFGQYTNAKCVNQLKGLGYAVGASAGEGVTAGGDFVWGFDDKLDDDIPYTGVSFNFGPGIKVPFPGEFHAGFTLTAGWDSDNGWGN